MNLELIDPFGRHVPDRIDATYNLPKDRALVPLCCRFNRRGTYLAVVYDDDGVAVFSCLSRTVAALYHATSNYSNDKSSGTGAAATTTAAASGAGDSGDSSSSPQQQQKQQQPPGRTTTTTTAGTETASSSSSCCFVSWSRRSRRLLVGRAGDDRVRWIDTTHPVGPELASETLWQEATMSSSSNNNTASSSSNAVDGGEDGEMPPPPPVKKQTASVPASSSSSDQIVYPTHTRIQTQASSFRDEEDWQRVYVKTSRTVQMYVANAAAKDHNNNNEPSTVTAAVVAVAPEVAASLSSTEDEEETNIESPVKKKRKKKKQQQQPQPQAGDDPDINNNNNSSRGKVKIHGILDVVLPGRVKNSLQAIDETMAYVVLEPGRLIILTLDDRSFCDDGPATYEGTVLIKSGVLCAAYDGTKKRLYVATAKNGLIVYSLVYDKKKNKHHHNKNQHHHNNNSNKDDSTNGPMTAATTQQHLHHQPPYCWFEQTDRYGLDRQHASQLTQCLWRRHKLLFHGKDGILRLYDTTKIDDGPVLFQDVVTKTKFTTTGMGVSGDGEYVVAAVNQFANTKYGIYIWDGTTTTGGGGGGTSSRGGGVRLVDKLTGSGTTVQCLDWHPTRPLLAVACGDGMIDIWGTRINWTAFAPDFQALPSNVEYIEREDEFDVDADGNYLHDNDNDNDDNDDNDEYHGNDDTATKRQRRRDDQQQVQQQDRFVNVLTIEPVPVFASDSEDEDEVFDFDIGPRVKNVIAVKGAGPKASASSAAAARAASAGGGGSHHHLLDD